MTAKIDIDVLLGTTQIRSRTTPRLLLVRGRHRLQAASAFEIASHACCLAALGLYNAPSRRLSASLRAVLRPLCSSGERARTNDKSRRSVGKIISTALSYSCKHSHKIVRAVNADHRWQVGFAVRKTQVGSSATARMRQTEYTHICPSSRRWSAERSRQTSAFILLSTCTNMTLDDRLLGGSRSHLNHSALK